MEHGFFRAWQEQKHLLFITCLHYRFSCLYEMSFIKLKRKTCRSESATSVPHSRNVKNARKKGTFLLIDGITKAISDLKHAETSLLRLFETPVHKTEADLLVHNWAFFVPPPRNAAQTATKPVQVDMHAPCYRLRVERSVCFLLPDSSAARVHCAVHDTEFLHHEITQALFFAPVY